MISPCVGPGLSWPWRPVEQDLALYSLAQLQTARLLLEHSALSAIIKLFTAGSAGSVASLSSFLSFRDYNPSHPTPRQALLGSRQIY